jgi:4-hydroxybenzoyl-CoA reductase subunit beta
LKRYKADYMIAEEVYFRPDSIEKALQKAKKYKSSFKYLAGGTDVLVNRFQQNEKSQTFIDITGISEMKEVIISNDYLKIGALVKLSSLKSFKEIKNEFPVLIEAADSVGSPLIRKTASIGGNILCENRCLFYNQSEWWRESIGRCLKCDGDICIATGGKKACFSELVSDTCPVLISMDARVEIRDIDGTKQIPLEELYSGDGVEPRRLTETAILSSILLPLNRGFEVVFKKLRQRKSLEFSSLTSSVSKDNDGHLAIALAGVDPGPVVIRATVKDDLETLLTKAVKKSRAIDNDMLTRKYRRQMIKTYLSQSFNALGL